MNLLHNVKLFIIHYNKNNNNKWFVNNILVRVNYIYTNIENIINVIIKNTNLIGA
jgi:hypothetical protein